MRTLKPWTTPFLLTRITGVALHALVLCVLATTPEARAELNAAEEHIAHSILKKTAQLIECRYADPARVLPAAKQFETLLAILEDEPSAEERLNKLTALKNEARSQFKKYCSFLSPWKLPEYSITYHLLIQEYKADAEKILLQPQFQVTIQALTLEGFPSPGPVKAGCLTEAETASLRSARRKIRIAKILHNYLVADLRQIQLIGAQAGALVELGIGVGKTVDALGRENLALGVSVGMVAGVCCKLTYVSGHQKGCFSEIASDEHEDQLLMLEYPLALSHSSASEPALCSHEIGVSVVSPALVHAVAGADPDGEYPTSVQSIHTRALPLTYFGRDLNVLKKLLGIATPETVENAEPDS